MKKYFILTNYSEYYGDKMVLLKAANDVAANAYINRTIDKIVRESVLEGLEITMVDRDDDVSTVIISSYDSRNVQHQTEYNFRIIEIDSITDFDKWYIFSKETDCVVDVDIVGDGLSAFEKFAEMVDDAAEVFGCKSVINWTLRTAKVGDYESFVLMSVQEMLEIK